MMSGVLKFKILFFNFYICSVKKQLRILCLFTFLLAGYYCQIGRFHTAFYQISSSHTYEKGLTKRILARLSSAEKSVHDKICVPKKNKLSEKYTAPDLTFFSAYEYLTEAASVFNSPGSYLSPSFICNGERGPPAMI
jgi:hypothetical protein